jgi:hypothetical protein
MRILIVLIALSGALACGPLVMIPGGRLSGTVAPVPDDWSFSDDVETVQLETRPDDPYSVNIWGVAVGDEFYVASGKSDNAWATHIAADDRVRLRVDESIYELRAVRDDSADGRERFLAAAKAKYDFEPDPEQTSDAILFKLVAR